MAAAFAGSTIAITGAAGGIGSALAVRMNSAGANLVLGDCDAPGLANLGRRLDDGRGHTVWAEYDATSEESAANFVALASETFGGIDHLVPAAGIYQGQPIAIMANDMWRRTMLVNLDAVMLLIRAAIPVLRQGGSVVTLTSLAGHRGSEDHSAYAASKGALIAFTRSVARELAPGIRVNAVSPGIIATEMTASLIADQHQHLLTATPMARIGRAEEVAGVIAFLCSADAGFLTGEVIHVNGGLYMA